MLENAKTLRLILALGNPDAVRALLGFPVRFPGELITTAEGTITSTHMVLGLVEGIPGAYNVIRINDPKAFEAPAPFIVSPQVYFDPASGIKIKAKQAEIAKDVWAFEKSVGERLPAVCEEFGLDLEAVTARLSS